MSLPILSLLGALSLAPEPLLLVLNKAEHTMVLVDPVTLAIVGRVATGHGPHEVAVSADGRTAYVTNYGAQVPGASISVVDLSSLTVREVALDSLRRPHGIVVSGGRVYFTAEVNQFVGRLDPAATGVDWGARTAQVATHMVVATPDGRTLYTANIGSHTISRIDLASGAVSTIAVGPQPEGIAVAPDGREVWVGHNGDGGVSVVDAASGMVSATLKAGVMPIRLVFTPDGRRVLASDARGGEVVVLDRATRAVVGRIPTSGVPVGILTSPDGRRAFVSLTQANRVAVIDLERLAVVAEVETGLGPDGLAWADRP